MEENSQKNVVNHFEAGSNCQVFNGNVTSCVFAMPGSTVTQQAVPQVADQPKKPAEPVSVSMLVACVDNVREYFWSPGAIGFVFCVCRDCYDYPNNMSQFERDFGCPEGSLSNTFRNNTYMHLHIDKWAQNGAKDRVLRLVEAYKKAVAERQKG